MRKLLILGIVLSGFAFAGTKDDGIFDLKKGCKDPGSFHNQLPPDDIKITCMDERFEWVPTGHDDATIFNKRTVCSKAVTNKPNIKAPSVCEPCDWPGSDYECGGFKEVCKQVEMTFTVTCDQVLAMESVNKFCQGAVLMETAATKEEIMAVKETGRTKKVCGVQDFMNGKPITPISQK